MARSGWHNYGFEFTGLGDDLKVVCRDRAGCPWEEELESYQTLGQAVDDATAHSRWHQAHPDEDYRPVQGAG